MFIYDKNDKIIDNYNLKILVFGFDIIIEHRHKLDRYTEYTINIYFKRLFSVISLNTWAISKLVLSMSNKP
jgi:hypothetical protein